MNIDNLCMNCMCELNDEVQCPHCGCDVDSPQFAPCLPLKTIIGEKYVVGRVISSNNEGSTYMAIDLESEAPVVIREFYPDAICERGDDGITVVANESCEENYAKCLNMFKDMWSKLARVRGFSAHIPVLNIIEANNTAYSVSEYIESITLRDFLLRSRTGYLKWEKANQLFMPVLSLLTTLHSDGIVHYGISPDTLLIGRDGKLRLTGFSIDGSRHDGSILTAEFFDGYTPLEQYNYSSQVGGYCDVYAFCAVIYRSLVGSVPQDAISRSKNDQLIIPARYAEIIPGYVINALMNGLQVDYNERTQNIETLHEELSATPSAVISSYSGVNLPSEEKPKAETKTDPVVYVEDDSTQRAIIKTFIIILIVGVLAVGGLLTYKFISNRDKDEGIEMVDNGETVQVPNFVNLVYSDISDNDNFKKVFTIKAEYVYNRDVPKGNIISQNISPGTKVKHGTEIIFKVSKGPEYALIPAVDELTVEMATMELESAGFVVVVEEKENTEKKSQGTVAGTNPGPGVSAEKGSTITLYVWGEPKDDGFKLPWPFNW